MKFKIRPFGGSKGIIIPKGFVEQYGKDGYINMDFSDMSSEAKEIVKGAIPIERPKDVTTEDLNNAQSVEEVMEEDDVEATLPGRTKFDFTLCKEHKGYKGSCKCP